MDDLMTVETPAREPAHAHAEDPLLRIQAVADQVGLTPRSIRYYEEIGLMKPAARSDGAYRLYDADDVARLQFIKALRDETGFSLGEIGQLLAIDRVARRLQTGDQLTVGNTVLASGGVDPHHPEPPEIALLAAPADERVLERGVDRLFR